MAEKQVAMRLITYAKALYNDLARLRECSLKTDICKKFGVVLIRRKTSWFTTVCVLTYR